MKIKTKDLKAMVSKVQKGSVPNGIVPLTGLIGVVCDGKELRIRTFDGFCHYVATMSLEGDEHPFVASVNASLFSSLVSKTTSEYVEIVADGKSMSFKGNGAYELEIVYDNGAPIEFPDLSEYGPSVGTHAVHTLNVKALSEAYASCEASMVNDMVKYPLYSGMYFGGGKCLSTNNSTACVHDGKVNGEGDGSDLIPYTALNFIGSLSDAEASFDVISDASGERFHLSDSSFDVYGPMAPHHSKYPAAQLQALLSKPMRSVAVKVADVLGALDRVTLFSKQLNDKGAYLSFHDAVVEIGCLKEGRKVTSVCEQVDCFLVKDGAPTDVSTVIDEPFEAFVNVDFIQSQFKALKSDMAVIGFGADRYVTVSGGSDRFMCSFIVKRA